MYIHISHVYIVICLDIFNSPSKYVNMTSSCGNVYIDVLCSSRIQIMTCSIAH